MIIESFNEFNHSKNKFSTLNESASTKDFAKCKGLVIKGIKQLENTKAILGIVEKSGFEFYANFISGLSRYEDRFELFLLPENYEFDEVDIKKFKKLIPQLNKFDKVGEMTFYTSDNKMSIYEEFLKDYLTNRYVEVSLGVFSLIPEDEGHPG